MSSFRVLTLVTGLAVLARPSAHGEGPPSVPFRIGSATTSARALDGVVRVPRLAVLDRPDESGFVCGQYLEDDHLRVRMDHAPGAGWLAIDPPATAIVWIEESRLERDEQPPSGDPPLHAWVRRPGAVIRSGHPGGKLPGPPRGRLLPGVRVQLVDHPAFEAGKPGKAARWVAIVPPPELAFFVRSDGVALAFPGPTRPALAERLASYEEPAPAERESGRRERPPAGWPPEIAAELDRLDGLYRVVLQSENVERWRFESVRAGYQQLLKQASDHPGLEEALRTRLARVTRCEQAARAARTIESILAKSRRRDHEVALLRRQLARQEQSRSRAYDAVGFIQPSARRADGRKLYALIGGEGSTIAYLDVPPGLDPDPYLARRVGVRGQARFHADLGTRLITVRDLEDVESR